MVKVGFLVEGDTEKILVQSQNFKGYCKGIGLEILPLVFPQKKKERGKDIFKNPEKVAAFSEILYDSGAEVIFCVRDLEDLPCITSAKDEIVTQDPNIKKQIVVKKIEAWFLADTLVMQKFFGENYQTQFPEIAYPESISMPDEKLKEISITTRNGRGIGDKLLFAKQFINNGFSIQNAANHPNCPSAAYFLNKLQNLAP